MTRSLFALVLAAAAVAALGTAVWVAWHGPIPAAEAPAPTSAARGGFVASAPSPAPPAGGDGPTLDDAMRALDLVRPARLQLAEDFTLPLASGQTFRLSDHRGQVVFLNFWATWCPPCREEMPAMERLYRRQKGAGFVLVAVSVDADPSVVAPFLQAHGLTFPVALDPKMDLANGYGVRALPSSFLIDRQGNLRAMALGPRHWDGEISNALIERMARR